MMAGCRKDQRTIDRRALARCRGSRPVMHTAERHMASHQREGSYEARTGADLRRLTAGHRGVRQHDTPATTGLERWGDWRSWWGCTRGDHGRQPRPWGRHRWGRWGGDGGGDPIA